MTLDGLPVGITPRTRIIHQRTRATMAEVITGEVILAAGTEAEGTAEAEIK